MELTGTLKEIFDERQPTPTFRVREFVVTTEDRYPQHILLQLVNEKIELLGGYQKGERVRVSFDLRGREGNAGRYYNSLNAWKIERDGGSAASPSGQSSTPAYQGGTSGAPQPPVAPPDPADADLPF